MEDFGDIEDDYIKSKTESCVEEHYEAFRCDAKWFLSQDLKFNQLIHIKFKADYLYLIKKYRDAIELYEEYLRVCPNISLTLKRDCLEGIARSYLGLNCFCHALEFGEKFKDLSTNFQTYTSCFSLLYDCYFKAGRFTEAVFYCQKLVALHSSNVDIWLKLGSAYCGGYKHGLDIPGITIFEEICSGTSESFHCSAQNFKLPCKCSPSVEVKHEDNQILCENSIIAILMCLLYAEFHLDSVIGSSYGFTRERNINLRAKIKEEIDKFYSTEPGQEIEVRRDYIKKKVWGIKYNSDDREEDFVDRESSKFTSNEEVNYALDFEEIDFANSWFKLGDS